MLLKQNQVLTNLASLDEEEAARAESAGLRWQVSSFASLTYSHMHTRLLYTISHNNFCFLICCPLQLLLKSPCFESEPFCGSGIRSAHAELMLLLVLRSCFARAAVEAASHRCFSQLLESS